jgi:2-amino-4-hydroxy-6-hydroxymethyldihydropteridine diphosphokinase
MLCYIGLGSNIGNAQVNVEKAIQEINQVKDVSVVKVASFYLTKAWGFTDQQDFINTAATIKTKLTADELLNVFQDIEKDMGRVRHEKWGPRIIDRDIFLYADKVVDQPRLSVPHPHILERNFVLVPLLELDSEITVPNQGKLRELIDLELINKDIIKV